MIATVRRGAVPESTAESPASPPRGAREVRAALISAAEELLVAMPAGRVSGRDIARAARVNYGLIHQYFGTKEAIFHEVLAKLSDDVTRAARAAYANEWWTDPRLLSTSSRTWRIVTNLVADAETMESMDWSFPLMRSFADGVAAAHPDLTPREVYARVALVGSVLLGWSILSPHYQKGFDLDPDEVADIGTQLMNLVTQWNRDDPID